MNHQVLTVRCQAFPESQGSRSINRVIVDNDGTIRVWDNIAGYYSTCHSLSEDDQRRIRKLAAEMKTELDVAPRLFNALYELVQWLDCNGAPDARAGIESLFDPTPGECSVVTKAREALSKAGESSSSEED